MQNYIKSKENLMNSKWEMVKEFHVKFEHPVSNYPVMLNLDRVVKRYNWMLEEINEFKESKNCYEQADAMVDLMYFALGTLVEMGVKPDKLFQIVHKANMDKLWPDGKPHYNSEGKTVKPANWKDPMEELIREIHNQEKIGACHHYEVEKAENFLCVPAVLSAIINCMTDINISQRELSLYFPEVNVPIGYNGPIINYKETSNTKNWGIIVNKNTINNLFNKLNIPLKESYRAINTISENDFEEIIKLNLLKGSSIICGYNYGLLNNMEDKINIGHVCIIKSISKDEKIEYLDPGPDNFGIRFVKSDLLYQAIRSRSDGLWIISPSRHEE